MNEQLKKHVDALENYIDTIAVLRYRELQKYVRSIKESLNVDECKSIQDRFKNNYIKSITTPYRPMKPLSTTGLKKTATGYYCFSMFEDPRDPLK